MEITVSNALLLLKQIRQRISDLVELRNKVSVEEHWMTATQKTVTPKYDVKKVDERIAKLKEMEYMLDNAIKAHNAQSVINIETIDPSVIFSPIE